ncbi:MAG: hypothetical protein AAF789_11235, partial [Bacteroidota bacterium]
MRRLITLLLSLVCITYTYSQILNVSAGDLTTVEGILKRTQDSTLIPGSVRYEKLPYYDDMGIASADEDGNFSLPLIKGETYIVTVTKKGYIPSEQNITAADDMNIELFIKEDIADLITLENLI